MKRSSISRRRHRHLPPHLHRRTSGLINTSTKSRSIPRYLVIVAAVFHLVVTLAIFWFGRSELLPHMFDRDGISISFASDGAGLRAEAAGLAEDLAQGRFHAWSNASSPFHLKLFSICFAVLGPLFGPTIVSAAPLNTLCYVLILVVVFTLGREAFDARTGLIAATIVAVWPSFLLHTTQLLKDPLFLIGMLLLVLLSVHLILRDVSWRAAILIAAADGLIAAFIWILRDSMAALMIITLACAAVMLVASQVVEGHFRPANVVGIVLMMVMTLVVMRVAPTFRMPDSPRHRTAPLSERIESATSIEARVQRTRQLFFDEFPNSSSNVDGDVQMNSKSDLISYLPRAAVIGFFAPFPKMWFASGNQVGATGRRVSGLETVALYVIEALAVVGLFAGTRRRRRFSAWFLGLVAISGLTVLGVVVVNVGALYRLRYLFVILLIILAAQGVRKILERVQERRGKTARAGHR